MTFGEDWSCGAGNSRNCGIDRAKLQKVDEKKKNT